MAELTMMLFEKGPENSIRCRAINGWFKMDSYVSSKEKLLLEIEKVKPDVVVMDLDLYEKIDGIETSRMIRLGDVKFIALYNVLFFLIFFNPIKKFSASSVFLKKPEYIRGEAS